MMKGTTSSGVLLTVLLAMGSMSCTVGRGAGTATASGWMTEDLETARLAAESASEARSIERLQAQAQEPERQDTLSREVSQLGADFLTRAYRWSADLADSGQLGPRFDGAAWSDGPLLGLSDPEPQQTPSDKESDKEKQATDNTGTNPVNFTYDFRLYTEMAQFKNNGGSMLTHTAEFRLPLGRDMANLRGEGPGSLFYDMGNMFQLRFRANYRNLSVATPAAAPFSTSEVSGIGDFDARLLAIAYASKTFILAPGLEAFFDTASNDALGSGTTTLGPVVFGVFPGLLGGRSLFAPGYQYIFDVGGGGSNVSRSQIDLYFVWLLAKGKNWLIVDPQIVLDHETSKEFATVEVEWGFMIVPKSGISGYLRPGVGIGSNRPYSWNLEIGLKFVW